MKYQFEDYTLYIGKTANNCPFASLNEFRLITTGETPEKAVEKLRDEYIKCLKFYQETGKPIPLPGSMPEPLTFAPDDQIKALFPLVADFLEKILGTSYSISFISNDSHLSSWEHHCNGGKAEVIRKTQGRYGVDITDLYDETIPVVLRCIKEKLSKDAKERTSLFRFFWYVIRWFCYYKR